MDGRRRPHRTGRFAVAVVASGIAAWLAAVPAVAATLFFDGPDGFGVGAEAARAVAESGDLPGIDARGLEMGRGLIDVTRQEVLDYDLVDRPSRGAPITATSRWSVANASGIRLDDLWLVILGAATYTPTNIGLALDAEDGWALLAVEGDGATYYYPAIHLGDLDAGESVALTMRHRVAEPLHPSDDGLLLPRLGIGVDRALAPAVIPEPASAWLCASVLTLLCVGSRRRRW